jgi:hypothetical protein
MLRKKEHQRVRLRVIKMVESRLLSSWAQKKVQSHHLSSSHVRVIHLKLLFGSLKEEAKVDLKKRSLISRRTKLNTITSMEYLTIWSIKVCHLRKQ